ncbi:MAG: hypothetical protein ABJA66_05355 [Actinomycetota bacterium]
MDDEIKEKTTTEAIRKPLSDEEREILMAKVSEKNKGKMVKMTDEEIEDFYDVRKF